MAPSNHQRRSGRRRDRADVAYDAARCDALVDPLDGCGNWLFPHYDPPNMGGFSGEGFPRDGRVAHDTFRACAMPGQLSRSVSVVTVSTCSPKRFR